jgi:hypothetical protein
VSVLREQYRTRFAVANEADRLSAVRRAGTVRRHDRGSKAEVASKGLLMDAWQRFELLAIGFLAGLLVRGFFC